MRRKAPAEGKIRGFIAERTSATQLALPSRLSAHDANYCDLEIHRFNGEEDAKEGAAVVGNIEVVIPANVRSERWFARKSC
jgi:hypothetical protein